MNKLKHLFFSLLLALSALIGLSTLWQYLQFGLVSVSSIAFTLTAPVDGTDISVVANYVFFVALPSILVFIASMYAPKFIKQKKPTFEFSKAFKRWCWIGNISLLVLTLFICNSVYDVVGYAYTQTQETNLYDSYSSSHYQRYFDAKDVKVTGTKTNNLVYLYLESYENTFSDKANGGLEDQNLLPELTQLAKDKKNISFSNTDQLGGPLQIEGTSWTMASMVNQHSGLTLDPVLFNTMDNYETFMPGSKMLGDFLYENNYLQTFMIGSSAKFAGTDHMFEQHGNYNIIDKSYFLEKYPKGKKYYNKWGARDYVLYDEAKIQLSELASKAKKNNQHFNFTMATIDTHHPYGFVCEKCDPSIEDEYQRVVSCASKLAYDFVSWCQDQDWAKDTTIIVVGDHNTMANKYTKRYDKFYTRTSYNCFINSKAATTNTKNRKFTRLDYYPTILASLGFNVEGDHLALGTNLFSKEATLVEEIGEETLNTELQKGSTVMEKQIYGFELEDKSSTTTSDILEEEKQ